MNLNENFKTTLTILGEDMEYLKQDALEGRVAGLFWDVVGWDEDREFGTEKRKLFKELWNGIIEMRKTREESEPCEE